MEFHIKTKIFRRFVFRVQNHGSSYASYLFLVASFFISVMYVYIFFLLVHMHYPLPVVFKIFLK